MTTKKPRLTIYLSEEQRDYLEKWSLEEKRTMSNLVGLLIDHAIKERESEKKVKRKA